MLHGFYSVEQWKAWKRGAKSEWMAVKDFDAGHSLKEVLAYIERRGKAGLFRVVQTQRLVWAEKTDGELRLRKWHAGSRETLSRTAKAFERDGGRWPV